MATTRPLTSEQSDALSARRVSVALSAGAGCGKTFVLTRRFLAQLEPDAEGRAPTRLHELVAITFTENAAREMRDRIRQACHERLLTAETPALAAYWRDLLRQMDGARISTIHSFCASLLRTHAVEAEIDPRFAMLEEAQAQTLRYEVIDDTLRSRLADRDETTLELISYFSLDDLRNRITDLLNVCLPEELQKWSTWSPAAMALMWEQFFEAHYKPLVIGRLASHRSVRQMLDSFARGGPTHAEMIERGSRLTELLADLPASANPVADVIEAIANATVAGGKKLREWADMQAYEEFKDAAGAFRTRAKAAVDNLQFSPDAAAEAAEVGRQMMVTALAVWDAYSARKAALGALDFNDLLQRAHRLLCDPQRPAVRQQVSRGIRQLLVDEFQDTDPVQVDIIVALCGEQVADGTLFFVGDAKQSIYRFRGADPRVFRQLRTQIPVQGRLPLTKNFRSQPAILHFVNALFCDDLGPEYERLVPHRPQVTAVPAIEFMWVTSESTEPQAAGRRGKQADATEAVKQNADTLRRHEARWIARRLRQFFDEQTPLVWDHQAQSETPRCRPLRPGDVAILFRALSDVEHYESALREAGLDYYLVGGHAFYAQQEVFDLLNLLRGVSSHCDDVSLVGALRSPIFNLADETLYWLAQHPEGLRAGLFASQPPPALDEQQRQRVGFAKKTLAQLTAEKDRLPIAQLIRMALDLTGYDVLLLAEFMGERKLANLQKLIEQARTFDRSGALGLPDFLVQLAEFVARQPKEALAASHAESSDVIRLMTIHQSKGLEFPLVVIPDLARTVQQHSNGVGYAPALGPVVQLDKDRREQLGATGYDMFRELDREEEEAERLRLLYVAATRAADYLILSAATKDVDKMSSPWADLLASRFDLRTGDCRAALPDDLAPPQIRVTLSEPPLGKKAPRSRRPSLDKLATALDEAPTAAWPKNVLPVDADRAARRRFSFSQLTGQLEPIVTADYDDADQWLTADSLANAQQIAPSATDRPASAQMAASALRGQLESRALGTLVHAVLERLDFAAPGDWQSRLADLARKHLRPVTATRRGAISAAASDQIGRFLQHPRTQQLAAAAQRWAELDFVLAWPPPAMRGKKRDAQSGGVYLEGVIDCLYRDTAGAWHVVDFKTNAVTADEVAAAAERYAAQLGIYAVALEQLLGQPPASLTLHFLAAGVEHAVPWNEALRKAVVQQTTAAIGRLRGLA